MERRISLEQLTVESPCPVAGDAIHGDAKVWYCDRCNLHVHNLSRMTRPEAEALMNRPGPLACITMLKAADGTVLTRESFDPPRGIRRRLSRLGAGIATLLAFITGIAAPGCRSSGTSTPSGTTAVAPPVRQDSAPLYHLGGAATVPNSGPPPILPAGQQPIGCAGAPSVAPSQGSEYGTPAKN